MERQAALYVFLLVSGFVLFSNVRKRATFKARLPYSNHTALLNYMTTVTNLPQLNPTITSVSKQAEWNNGFIIYYTERLSQAPLVNNYATAEYNIVVINETQYNLHSSHNTCFYTDLLCVTTTSLLVISQTSLKYVDYTEDINYTCPRVFNTFCFNEVLIQRSHIINHLHQHFVHTNQRHTN